MNKTVKMGIALLVALTVVGFCGYKYGQNTVSAKVVEKAVEKEVIIEKEVIKEVIKEVKIPCEEKPQLEVNNVPKSIKKKAKCGTVCQLRNKNKILANRLASLKKKCYVK